MCLLCMDAPTVRHGVLPSLIRARARRVCPAAAPRDAELPDVESASRGCSSERRLAVAALMCTQTFGRT